MEASFWTRFIQIAVGISFVAQATADKIGSLKKKNIEGKSGLVLFERTYWLARFSGGSKSVVVSLVKSTTCREAIGLGVPG